MRVVKAPCIICKKSFFMKFVKEKCCGSMKCLKTKKNLQTQGQWLPVLSKWNRVNKDNIFKVKMYALNLTDEMIELEIERLQNSSKKERTFIRGRSTNAKSNTSPHVGESAVDYMARLMKMPVEDIQEETTSLLSNRDLNQGFDGQKKYIRARTHLKKRLKENFEISAPLNLKWK